MTEETGVDAGARRVGAFFLWAIPLVLGVAASVWLGFFIGVQNEREQIAQEQRKAVYVGAEHRPTAKIQIQVVPVDCLRLDRADLDGGHLVMYATNTCNAPVSYVAWHWQGISPDGTVIAEHYDNGCPLPVYRGDKAECEFNDVSTDDRIKTMRLWVTAKP